MIRTDYNNESVDAVDAEFPTTALPRGAERIVREASDAIGCPPELVGLPVLVALSSAIGNSRLLKLKNSWKQGATLWLASVAPPGAKKSPAQLEAQQPAFEYQHKLKKEYEEAYRQYEKPQEEDDDIEEEEPVFERVWVDDTTVEALTPILRDNRRGLALFKDELTGFIRQMDQYKSGGNDRQFYLSVWGNQPYTVDRKSNQSPIFLSRPFISLYGGIQPARLSELSKGIEDGMLDRFLFAYSDFELNGWTEDEISDEAREEYKNLYDGLRDLEMQVDDYGKPNPDLVTFSPEAKEFFINEYNLLQLEVKEPGFPTNLQSPWSKMSGYLASLTLIMCVCRTVEDGSEEVVIPEDVMWAKSLLSYFKEQARRVYGFLKDSDPLDVLAGDVARFLEYMGGSFEDEPMKLHALIKSDCKPGEAKDLTKMLKDISERNPDLVVESKSKRVGSQVKRFTSLYLENSVNSVNTANDFDPTPQEVTVVFTNMVSRLDLVKRCYAGEVDKASAVELATRLVLYELDLSFECWQTVEPMLREELDKRIEDLTPPF